MENRYSHILLLKSEYGYDFTLWFSLCYYKAMRDRSLPLESYVAKLDRMGLPTLSSVGFYFRNGNTYYILYPSWDMSYKYTPQMLYIVSGGISRGDTSLEEFTKFITLIEMSGLWLKRQDEDLFKRGQEQVYKDYSTYEVYKGKEFNMLGYVFSDYFLTTSRKEFKMGWEKIKSNNFVLTLRPEDDTFRPPDDSTVLIGTIFKWEGSDWLLYLEFLVWQSYYSLLYRQRPYQVSPITSASINSGTFWRIPEVRALHAGDSKARIHEEVF